MQKDTKSAMFCIALVGAITIGSGMLSYHYLYKKDSVIQVDVHTALYLNLLKKINHINFETKKFYDEYARSIMDIEAQPERVVNTTFQLVTSLLQGFSMIAVITSIHPIYILFGILASVIGVFII